MHNCQHSHSYLHNTQKARYIVRYRKRASIKTQIIIFVAWCEHGQFTPFTLQFLPYNSRTKALQKISDNLLVGRSFTISGKILFPSSKLQNIMEFICFE